MLFGVRQGISGFAILACFIVLVIVIAEIQPEPKNPDQYVFVV